MKLRINVNSVRLRLLRSEVAEFIKTGRIEQMIHFSSAKDAFLSYGLEHDSRLTDIDVRYKQSEVVIIIPSQQAIAWAETDQVGIYCAVDLGAHGSLDIIVEKDFACLDLSNADNHDTYQNPQIGAVC